MNIMKYEEVVCHSCNKDSAIIFWDQRYNGYRARCVMCGGNWAESWWLRMGNQFRVILKN